MAASPDERNLLRNEEVFRSLLQATVRDMFDDDEDHNGNSMTVVTPVWENLAEGASCPTVDAPMHSSIKAQRLFATPVAPDDPLSITNSNSLDASQQHSPTTPEPDFETLDAELEGFEAFLKSHFDIPKEPPNLDIEELEHQLTCQHEMLLSRGLALPKNSPIFDGNQKHGAKLKRERL